MTARPTEIKSIANILEAGGETPEQLAKEVIDALDTMRTDRPMYTVVSVWGRASFGTGPFATPKQAETAIGKGKIPVAVLADKNVIVKTWAPRHAEQALERASA